MAVRKDEVQISIAFLTDESRQYAKLVNENKQFIKELQKAKREGKDLSDTINKMVDSGKQAGKIDLSKLAPTQLVQRARQLSTAMRLIPQSAPQYNQLETELKQVNDQLAIMRKRTRGVADVMPKQGIGDKVGELLRNPLTIVGGLAAVGAAAVNVAQDVGLIVEEVGDLRREISQLTDASGEELDNITVRVRAIGKTFEQNESEILRSANTLVKEFGISYDEALGQIENGFLRGANASGEFLDNVREYSTQFREAGFSAEDFIDLSVRAQQEGIFSDKGLDLVKEFGLRIREQTTAVRDAMDNAFGQEFTNRIFKGINDGSLSSKEALQLVAQELKNTEIPANELQTVIADVFSAPGEDAGLRFLETLGEIQDGLSGASDETNYYIDAQRDLLAANIRLADAENDLTKQLQGTKNSFSVLWTNIKSVGLETLRDLLGIIEYLPIKLKATVAAIKQPFKNLFGSPEDARSTTEAYYQTLTKELTKHEAEKRAVQDVEDKKLEAQEEAARKRRITGRDIEQKKAVAGLAAIKVSIRELQKELENTEGADAYVRITQRIAELTGELQAKQIAFNNAVIEAAGGSANPDLLPVQAIENAGQEILRILEETGLSAEQVTAESQQRINAIILNWSKKTADEQRQIMLDKNQAIADADAALQEKLRVNNIETLGDIGVTTAEFLTGQIKSQKEFAKQLIFTLLDALRRQVLINIAGAVGTEAATKPFPANLGSAAIKTAAINAAFEVAKAAIRGFSEGGHTGKGMGAPDSSGQRPAGIVHANEWVAPQWMVQSPTHGPLIHQLERARRGYADGGFVNPDTTPVSFRQGLNADNAQATQQAEMLLKAVHELRRDFLTMEREKQVVLKYQDVEDAGARLNELRVDASL